MEWLAILAMCVGFFILWGGGDAIIKLIRDMSADRRRIAEANLERAKLENDTATRNCEARSPRDE